jgi:hypothetical protein
MHPPTRFLKPTSKLVEFKKMSRSWFWNSCGGMEVHFETILGTGGKPEASGETTGKEREGLYSETQIMVGSI